MALLQILVSTFSLYSAVPMPQVPWNEKNLRWILCAFPLVGLVIGLAWWGWGAVCGVFPVPPLLRGAGWTLLPAALTGGIHLDGYADTVDALSSHGTREKKQAILKDPRCGAFAVIALCSWSVGTLALCASLGTEAACFAPLLPAFVLSRAMSGAALTVLPLTPGSSLSPAFAEGGSHRLVRAVLTGEALVAALSMLALGGIRGVAMLAAALLVLARCSRTALREFGGVSGDWAGWFLQKAEFWMLAALVLVQIGETAR